jgi:membrane-associated progesterone receptor component
MAEEVKNSEGTSFVTEIFNEIIGSPLNLLLIGIITFLLLKIFKSRQPKPFVPAEPELPKLRRDFTVQELKAFDGKQEDGRVLVAVNGNVYDVTKGKRFYGPGKLVPHLFYYIIALSLVIYLFKISLPLQMLNLALP